MIMPKFNSVYKNNLMNINQNSTIRNNKMLWFLRMQGLISIGSANLSTHSRRIYDEKRIRKIPLIKAHAITAKMKLKKGPAKPINALLKG